MSHPPKLASAAAFFLASTLVTAAPLKLCFEDVPKRPWTMPDGTGLTITLLNRAAKQLGEQFTYIAEPWSRCVEDVKVGNFDGYFPAAITDERRQYAIFPTLPNGSLDKSAVLHEDHFDVYLRKGGNGHWDGKKLESPRPIIAPRGYVVSMVLKENGYAVDESIKSAEDGLRFLAQDMADVAVLQGAEARDLVQHDPRFQNTVVAAPIPYLSLPLFVPINRKRYAENPERIEAIWGAIRTVRNSAEYQKLLEAAGVR